MNYFNLLWNLYQLKRNTGMRREQLITLQEKKLRELLVYAYDNSTYYHRVFEEAGITRKQIPLMPLSAFPVLDKQLLMEHFNELVTVSDLKQEDLRRFDREESTEQKNLRMSTMWSILPAVQGPQDILFMMRRHGARCSLGLSGPRSGI